MKRKLSFIGLKLLFLTFVFILINIVILTLILVSPLRKRLKMRPLNI